MSGRIPHVALLIETSREYGRGLLRGIIRHNREHGPWSIYFQPRGLGEPPPRWLRGWHGDGILVRVDTPAMANAVRESGIPAIDLRIALPDLDMPKVGIDNRVIVDLAFGHLRDRGFRHFAFCGLPPGLNVWVDFRGENFARAAEAALGVCHVFPARRQGSTEAAWEQEQEEIAAWLTCLPRPVGVMACHDDRGLQVLDACRRAGLNVPDEVAVIGVDNDEFLCNLAQPPLSSIDVGVERAGYEAAALLDRMMTGQEKEARTIALPPLGVVVRQSTDVIAIDDPDLVTVIRHIREHACDGLRVDDLLRRSRLSASTLQRRCKAILGRTLKEEMLRVQLEQAKHLLATTDLPTGDIAVRCGFADLKRLSTIFRLKMGKPPGVYRRQVRKG
jgi:LacI family transcriptional regulator